MSLPIHQTLRKSRRLGQVALTALLIGIGGAALATMPLGNAAFADKGGNGGGGDHGHGGDHGGGHGGGGGGQGHGGGQGGGQGHSDKAGHSGVDNTGDDADTASSDDSTDDSLTAHGLGKLNGFFHASPNGLANASPNSSIGQISHTFKDALSDFAAANEQTDDTTDTTDTTTDTTTPTGPSVDDLGAILAGATNKTVTASQVKAIIDRLAEQNPNDTSLNDFAGSVDESTCQDIADAANAAKSGETTSDSTDGDTTDTSTDGTSSEGSDTSSTDTTTTVTTN